MIKASLNKKLIVVFSSILIVVVMLNLIINSQLLPRVYENNKLDAMNVLYEDIYNRYENNSDTDAIVEIVKDVLAKENLRVFIWDNNDRLVIDSLPLSNDENFFFNDSHKPSEHISENFSENSNNSDFRVQNRPFDRRFFYGRSELFLFYSEVKEDDVIRKEDNYTIFSYVSFGDVKDENLCLRGSLPNNYKLLIQMPFASIDEAVFISNSLLFFVGIVMLFIGIIVVAITSRNIARPIKELSDIAESMENLDFSRKYKHNRSDELGKLGDSVNSLSEKLEHTINELYEKNDKLQEDIEFKSQIDNIRKEFIANASHELKTPVALISGYAEGLRDNIADNEATRKLYTDVIIEETQKMDHIIRQMLDLMEIDGKENILNGTKFSLTSLATEVIISFDLLLKSKDIKVNFDVLGDCTVFGEYWRIYQALSNYITNAVNHIGGERRVKISVSEDDKMVKVSVFNTGEPIPEDDIPNIWERFYKVDKAHTREYGGTGLGLSIVRSVIELHKGKYGVVNHSDGVEFYFILNKENLDEI